MRISMHSTTERGPRAVPCLRLARRGGRYPVAASTESVGLAGRLRCDARATRAAAMPLAAALNAPPLHGFSPVRRLRRRTSPCVAALLAAPQVAATGYRPPRSTTEVFIGKQLGGAGKAVVGCAPAATYAAPSSAELMAARAQRALQHLTRRDCLSGTTDGSEASFSAGHEIEQRRVPLEQRGAAASERRCIPGRGFASLGPLEESTP